MIMMKYLFIILAFIGAAAVVVSAQGAQECLNGGTQYSLHYGALSPGGGTECTPSNPCGACAGDCDSDSDCAGSLICMQRSNNSPEVPGCAEDLALGAPVNHDYCYDPSKLVCDCGTLHYGDGSTNSECNSVDCDICGGDCDNDSHCAGGYKCMQRTNNFPLVPGCTENAQLRAAKPDHDYCYDPDGGCNCVSTPSCNCTGTGYEGDLCLNNIDECSSNPCVNGECFDRVNTFFCDCTDLGFEGLFCETNTNDCSVDSCENGVCVDGINGFTCDCTNTAYGGDSCELLVTPECVSHACQHGSLCEPKDSLHYGALSPGGGTECTPTNPCGECAGDCDSDSDCAGSLICMERSNNSPEVPGCAEDLALGAPVNHDYCYDPSKLVSDNNYKCTCLNGWTGEYCEEDVDDCVNHQCQNGGTCRDMHGSYRCDCNGIDFEGQYCENAVNGCINNLCENGAICRDTDQIGHYQCDCVWGTTGQYCQNFHIPDSNIVGECFPTCLYTGTCLPDYEFQDDLANLGLMDIIYEIVGGEDEWLTAYLTTAKHSSSGTDDVVRVSFNGFLSAFHFRLFFEPTSPDTTYSPVSALICVGPKIGLDQTPHDPSDALENLLDYQVWKKGTDGVAIVSIEIPHTTFANVGLSNVAFPGPHTHVLPDRGWAILERENQVRQLGESIADLIENGWPSAPDNSETASWPTGYSHRWWLENIPANNFWETADPHVLNYGSPEGASFSDPVGYTLMKAAAPMYKAVWLDCANSEKCYFYVRNVLRFDDMLEGVISTLIQYTINMPRGWVNIDPKN